MKHLLLSLALGLLLVTPLRAQDEASQPATSSGSEPIWSLEVAHTRVEAGGFSDGAHQSAFVVRATDDKKRPLAGIPVKLPTIWDEKGDLADRKFEYPDEIKPQVQWDIGEDFALTDAKGEAHGLFTSGGYECNVTLHGPGTTQAPIEQVWNDNPSPFGDFGYVDGWGNKTAVRYSLQLHREGQIIPVKGHNLILLFKSVKLRGYNLTTEGRPKTEEGLSIKEINWPTYYSEGTPSSSQDEMTRWETIMSWIRIEPIKETSDGIYEASYTPIFPGRNDNKQSLPVIDGFQVQSFKFIRPYVRDKDVWTDVAKIRAEG